MFRAGDAARKVKEGNTSDKGGFLDSRHADMERIHGQVDKYWLKAGLWEADKWDSL